ncbi:DUF5988 family protein [Catenulispora subtropica]|uniref:Uncharacterized protein n=1 Tax=Catenulispora subtropica TaxID=450798 RepID=A0ABP5DYX3_9ACTN
MSSTNTVILEGGPAELAGRTATVATLGDDLKIKFGNGYEHFRATARRTETPHGLLLVYEWWERTEMTA